MGSAALNVQFSRTDTFAGGLHQAAGTEGRLEDEHGITAPRFGFDELAGRFAADFFVGRPKEDDLLLQVKLGLPKSLECKERLDDASLHVEDSGTVSLSPRDAERHFLQGSGGINGIVMAEHEELTLGASLVWDQSYAQMVAAVLLRNVLDMSTTLS